MVFLISTYVQTRPPHMQRCTFDGTMFSSELLLNVLAFLWR